MVEDLNVDQILFLFFPLFPLLDVLALVSFLCRFRVTLVLCRIILPGATTSA